MSNSEDDKKTSETNARAETKRVIFFIYKEIKSFFGSGFSYIIVGAIFLSASHNMIKDNGHPSFIFLIAILGLAIVLYGTGTEAAGAGKTDKLNVAIAGGAGVLAALFGFGVLEYSGKIASVFTRTHTRAVLELTTDNKVIDLNKCDVSAEDTIDGRPLHLWKRNQTAQVYIPVYSTQPQTRVMIAIICKGSDFVSQKRFEQFYTISWENKRFDRSSTVEPKLKKEAVEVIGSGSEFTYSVKDKLEITDPSSIIVLLPSDPGSSQAKQEKLKVDPN